MVLKRWREDYGLWNMRKWRDYYHVMAATNLMAEIYEDLTWGGWYLQRVND
jgi:uncharacterized membrane protein (DUF2068 family)